MNWYALDDLPLPIFRDFTADQPLVSLTEPEPEKSAIPSPPAPAPKQPDKPQCTWRFIPFPRMPRRKSAPRKPSANKFRFSDEARHEISTWLVHNWQNPYPSQAQKCLWQEKYGLPPASLNTFLVNKRQRIFGPGNFGPRHLTTKISIMGPIMTVQPQPIVIP